MTKKRDRKEIVYINQSSGYLMVDIINAKDSSYRKTLLAGNIVERNNKLDENVKVRYTIPYNRKNKITRIFTWIWSFIQMLFWVKFKHRNSELFIVSNPPFSSFIPLFCSNRYSILIYDVYPDILTEMGWFKPSSIVISFWQKLNKKVYLSAEKVYTLNSSMKKQLTKYVSEDKIFVVPIWTDNKFFQPIEKKSNLFIKKHALSNKFIVMYSGNLGLTHDVEIIPEIANLINIPEIEFIIIGEGDKRSLLDQKIKELKLTNCQLLPLQEISMLPSSLSAADISIVTLGKAASNSSIPSKVFNIMSVGTPVLGITKIESELSSIILKNEIGAVFEREQILEIKDFILNLYHDEHLIKKYKQNAILCSQMYSSENAKLFN
jgi:glycosyltransferase involved in cell wall biosynthesis